jgi:diguanylate cyclase (GGDEF)-like protein
MLEGNAFYNNAKKTITTFVSVFATPSYLARLALSAVLFGATLASAATAQEETRALERAVSDDPRQAISVAERWLREAQAKGDKPGQLKALRLLAMAHDQTEEGPMLHDNAERGAALARELGDWEALCEFIAARATAASNEGNYAAATKLYDQAIELAEQYRLQDNLAKVYVSKANMYQARGRVSDALELLFKAYAIFETQGNKLWMSSTLSALANVYSRDTASVEDLKKAIDYHQRSLGLMDPKTSRFDVGTDYHNLGVTYHRLKDYKQARPYFEKSLVLARELKDPVSEAFLHYRLGLLAKEERKFGEALAYFDQALPVFVGAGNASLQFLIHLARAQTLSRLERKKESFDALAAAQTIVVRLGSPKRDVSFYETGAEIYAHFGDYEKAFRNMESLRQAEQRRAETANNQLSAELQLRFDVKQNEAENALLRARERESEARRLALILALILSLVVLGGLALYLVRQAQRNQRFVNLAMRDELTGLPNRRSILEFGRMQFRGRRAADAGFCVALLDLDHFKNINDKFGHDVGDAALIAFSQACQRQLRSNDRIGRFGGEEFLLVMPGSDASKIPGVFQRLRDAVQKAVVAGLPADRRLTFSMGGAEAKGDSDTLDGLIKRADEVLYRAKDAGRDRFAIA